MPYLDYLVCEKCGMAGRLDVDFVHTIQSYQKDGRKSSFINQATMIWDYIIYTCYQCNTRYRYTYQDVERRVREYFCSLSEEHLVRYQALMDQRELEEQRIAGKHKPSPGTISRIKSGYTHKGK